MNVDKEIVEFLSDKLLEKVSELARFYFVEFSGNEETKKTVEANRFMEALMTGKGFTKGDQPFMEKNKELFDHIYAYVRKIKELTKEEDK